MFGAANTVLKEDHPMTLLAKFGKNWSSGLVKIWKVDDLPIFTNSKHIWKLGRPVKYNLKNSANHGSFQPNLVEIDSVVLDMSKVWKFRDGRPTSGELRKTSF